MTIKTKKLLDEMTDALFEKKAVLLTGNTGVGKTYLAKKISEKLVERKYSCFPSSKDQTVNVEIISCHNSVTYEEIVGGITADTDSGKMFFEYKDKIFLETIIRAAVDYNEGKGTKFNIKKREIRQTIARYKGISVYRDNILVLPKSEATKDWLGIDIRRVSALGKRLSTSQMVGILSITSERNPELKDTTDREKLVDTKQYKQFCKITESIILTLENLRNMDKKTNNTVKNPTLTDLLSPLEPSALESKVELMIQGGGSSEEILDVIHEYSANTEKNLSELNDRLIYYAQTASLGSVSAVIMHEIRSGMTVIKRFLNRMREMFVITDPRTKEYFEDAETSHQRLLEVANSFASLYRKNIYKEKHKTKILEAVESSVRLIKAKKEAKKIDFIIDIDENDVCTMHIGEFQTILINLLDNACYWLRNAKNKKIKISAKLSSNNKNMEIVVSDNGPGIIEEEKQKIFQPGVTAKPQGIGMGLVIVTELLNNHNCKIRLETPGEYGGATFAFEVPME